MVPVSHIKEGLVTAPGFPIRVRWVHVFLIGLISKPCACHDALIPSLLPSKKKKKKKTLSLSMSPSRKCSFSKGKWAPLSWKTDFLSYDCPAVGELAFLLHKRAISWRRRKKRGGGNQTACCSLFFILLSSASAPEADGKEAALFWENEYQSSRRQGNVFLRVFYLVGLARRNKFVDNCKGSPGKYLLVKSPNRLELNKLENAAIMAEYKFMASV